MVVYESEIYEVEVGDSVYSPDNSFLTYKAINRYTGVIEVEDSMLARIISAVNQLDDALTLNQNDDGSVSFVLNEDPDERDAWEELAGFTGDHSGNKGGGEPH